MEEQNGQGERYISVHHLPMPYFLVIADERLIYEGSEERAVSQAFYQAARAGARSIACYINGVKIIHSKSVINIDEECP